MASPLVSSFLGALPAGPRQTFETDLSLQALLEAGASAGRQRVGGAALSDEAYGRHLASVLARGGPPLEERRLDDLFVAAGCTQQDPACVASVDALLRSRGLQILRRNGLTAAAAEEILQRVRERLLVRGAQRAPLIDTYSGRGELEGFLVVIVSREAATAARSVRHEVSLEEALLEDRPGSTDPELALLKARYREGFRAALADAVATLDETDRAVLRHQVVEGLELKDIAVLLDLHPVTVAKRVTRAREGLARALRRALAIRLHLSASELRSALKLLESQPPVSLERLLKKEG